ncbi:hypothetical protein LNQ52_20080 [Klebsiella pneumoniae subsp. pneumoniae]|nr:hypothetical protein [Klebsiella pneumoniae subsp. pneumoniae]
MIQRLPPKPQLPGVKPQCISVPAEEYNVDIGPRRDKKQHHSDFRRCVLWRRPRSGKQSRRHRFRSIKPLVPLPGVTPGLFSI